MDLRTSILAAIEDPNRAFILGLIGCLLVGREFLRPGRVLPGIFGALAVIAAFYSLWRYPWTVIGSLSLCSALIFIAVQGLMRASFVPLGAAVACAAIGARWLIGPGSVTWPVACLAGCAAGLGSWLLYTARRARQNKTKW